VQGISWRSRSPDLGDQAEQHKAVSACKVSGAWLAHAGARGCNPGITSGKEEIRQPDTLTWPGTQEMHRTQGGITSWGLAK
jgi:hypothetical protein